MADELGEDKGPGEEEEDVEVEMDDKEMEEANEAMEEERDGEMVAEEGMGEVELVINWEVVKEDAEEVDDGLWEMCKEGLVEEVTEDGTGESEEVWMEKNRGGMEIGEGEGRAERAGAVLGCFVMEEDEERDEEVAWSKEVFVYTRVELPVRGLGMKELGRTRGEVGKEETEGEGEVEETEAKMGLMVLTSA